MTPAKFYINTSKNMCGETFPGTQLQNVITEHFFRQCRVMMPATFQNIISNKFLVHGRRRLMGPLQKLLLRILEYVNTYLLENFIAISHKLWPVEERIKLLQN